MRSLLLLVTLTLIAYALSSSPYSPGLIHVTNDTTCSANKTCVGEGDSCKPYTGDDTGCSYVDGNCCSGGLTCFNKTCQTDNLGSSCAHDDDCFDSFSGVYSSCVNKTCAILYNTNDECEQDSDCYSNDCSDDGLCVGIPMGQKCKTAKSCVYDGNCLPNENATLVCQPRISPGDDCSANPTNCYYGYFCNASNICVQLYSVASGGDCSSSDQCESGYVCNDKKCSEGAEWDEKSCDSDEDCDNGEKCYCSEFSGDQKCIDLTSNNYTTGSSASSDLNECLIENNCTGVSQAPNSCCQVNCGSDSDDLESDNCDYSLFAMDSCADQELCGGFPVWAIIVIVIVAVILVLVIIVVAVMCMKKKRSDYDSI